MLVMAAWHGVNKQLRGLARVADVDEDGELTLEDSKLAYSRVAPQVRRHPALAVGMVGGFLAGYGVTR